MIESIDDLIVFLKHFHRNLLEDPSLPPEMIPEDLFDELMKDLGMKLETVNISTSI